MRYNEADTYLKQVVADLKAGKKRKDKVRNLLELFGFQRRGKEKASIVRKHLRKHKLTTEPDFNIPYIDDVIHYQLRDKRGGVSSSKEVEATEIESDDSPTANDPTYRINKLESANLEAAGRKLVTVEPTARLDRAVTAMLRDDFSQLPVMNGKTVKGVISWKSIGKKLALKQKCELVKDCMAEAAIVSSETSLFQAIPEIVKHDYVLVEKTDRTISGLVTTSDLSMQFKELSEPFLLLAEIERHLRPLIDSKFDKDELRQAMDPTDQSREVNAAADLTFGEYLRLLENPANWDKMKLPLDRQEFIKGLDEIREIRNDVMHFEPEGIADADVEKLRSYVGFLQDLHAQGVF